MGTKRATKEVNRPFLPATHDGVRFAAAAQSLPRAGLAPRVEAPRHHSARRDGKRDGGWTALTSCWSFDVGGMGRYSRGITFLRV